MNKMKIINYPAIRTSDLDSVKYRLSTGVSEFSEEVSGDGEDSDASGALCDAVSVLCCCAVGAPSRVPLPAAISPEGGVQRGRCYAFPTHYELIL